MDRAEPLRTVPWFKRKIKVLKRILAASASVLFMVLISVCYLFGTF